MVFLSRYNRDHMRRLIANLSLVPRLALVKKTRRLIFRGNNSFAPYIVSLKNVRRGSKLSRVARHIFEHKHAKKILGTNLAFAIAVSSLMPHQLNFEVNATESPVITTSLEANLTTEITVRYPLKTIKITQGFRLFHPGIDFDGITGDPVYPIMKGVVEAVEYSRFAYGNSIIINHNNGYSSRYAHLSKVNVAQGIEVTPFTVIGEVGSTGRSSGDHLHLEVYEKGRAVNPLSILSLQ